MDRREPLILETYKLEASVSFHVDVGLLCWRWRQYVPPIYLILNSSPPRNSQISRQYSFTSYESRHSVWFALWHLYFNEKNTCYVEYLKWKLHVKSCCLKLRVVWHLFTDSERWRPARTTRGCWRLSKDRLRITVEDDRKESGPTRCCRFGERGSVVITAFFRGPLLGLPCWM